MNTIRRRKRAGSRKRASLALYVTVHRKRYGEHGLSRADLAELAGISPRLLRDYETCRSLPKTLRSSLLLASALRVHVEDLVASDCLENLRVQVERRRAKLKLGSSHAIGFRCQYDE